ncbi:MAG TPA: NlpC/P60 family protein, partial [Marmoricola sp.]|nr:NlpC/P60 family protein [Marmoricola sp.]
TRQLTSQAWEGNILMPTSTRMPSHARLKNSMGLLGALMIAMLSITLVPGTAAPASAATSATTVRTAAAVRAQREINAFDIARRHIGAPYEYGASGPGAFDCSGLTHYSLVRAGFNNIPRTAAAQAAHARRIKRSQLRQGDFIFFYSGSSIYHVGYFVRWDHGVPIILHAPRPGDHVRMERVWTNNWFPATLR